MSKKSLVLTLGHNASAIAIQDGFILGGYEEERFSQKKADSTFPINAILELKKRFGLEEDIDIYVSHWFLDGLIPGHPVKYWGEEFIRTTFPQAKIHGLIPGEFTHHDAHMRSAEVFAGRNFPQNHHVYVMDGFGTHGECISIYEVIEGESKVVARFYGFMNSLGLFYQYATAFCGMQMNNHEYKMLAYETRINMIPVDLWAIDEYIDCFSEARLKSLIRGEINRHMDPVVMVDALVRTQGWVDGVLTAYLEFCGMSDCDLLTRRILVSYFAQRHVENMVLGLHRMFHPTHLLTVGGVFYNVKLNHKLCNEVPGKFSVMPLAGDQGAGLGVYDYYNGDLQWPEHLFWGDRDLNPDWMKQYDGILVCNEYQARQAINQELERIGFVNVIRGDMEFGPRALCHTTTFAKPFEDIGAKVNKMNDRTNEMPFALVVTEQQAKAMFKEIGKVHKSLEYMIMAREFNDGQHERVAGGAHFYPTNNRWTCRPQVTSDPFVVHLLDQHGPLINTSWNYHGVPIVRSSPQALYTHQKERAAMPHLDIKTIIVTE